MLLSAQDVTKRFGSFTALQGADLDIEEGAIIGLIGPNGAGKSTFFNCLAGDLTPSVGRIRFAGADVTRASPEAHARLGLARTFQVPTTCTEMSVLENVMVGAFLRHKSAAAARERARAALALTGLADQAGLRASALGTPGRKRLELARALATDPKLLLLDEALAGLTSAEIRQAIPLLRRIHAQGITLVIVEHVMEVIVTLAERVLVFNHGRIIARGTPRAVMADPAVIEAYLGHGHARGTPL